jgi:hypothetical protein
MKEMPTRVSLSFWATPGFFLSLYSTLVGLDLLAKSHASVSIQEKEKMKTGSRNQHDHLCLRALFSMHSAACPFKFEDKAESRRPDVLAR